MHKFVVLVFVSLFSVLFFGCGDVGPYSPKPYCETHECLPSTEAILRPTSFALELVFDKRDSSFADSTLQADSTLNNEPSRLMARLFTLDCDYLPGEDSTQTSTFCVDSLTVPSKAGKVHLPQQSKYTYDKFSPYPYSNKSRALAKYVELPLDDENHLRFTLVDRQNSTREYDLDLSQYVNIYKAHGDTFDFKFPKNTEFKVYTYDSIYNAKSFDSMNEVWDSPRYCYRYEVIVDSVHKRHLYCVVREEDYYEGYVFDREGTAVINLQDSSECKSQQFIVDAYSYRADKMFDVTCRVFAGENMPETLTLSNLYSERNLKRELYELYGDSLIDEKFEGREHTWHSITRLEGLGPTNEDTFTVYVTYSE